ncbi:MAG: hypothetical protein HWE15_09790 [Algoriphagus sp.]|uniref:hypothetical protein n=1 Tax=Algoriphagus sp. TaxID=1872435 RepID=UPI001793E844|nr:hypothetical protein [Algoriphagus sp.]NVJ86584.1 hypothetical protein [Algoriphagus sp.]
MAQTEQDKPVMDMNRPLEKPLMEEDLGLNHEPFISPSAAKPSQESKTLSPLIPSTPIRREVVIGPEGKKPETPSTLSFNIFLYVLEKFKAD